MMIMIKSTIYKETEKEKKRRREIEKERRYPEPIFKKKIPTFLTNTSLSNPWTSK